MRNHIADWFRRLANCSQTLLALVITYSGTLWLRHKLRRPRILVLAYRRVTPDEQIDSCAFPEMHVSTSYFDKQLAALRRFYRIVPLAELQRILRSGEPLREHLAVLTFDGGYHDNYEHALTILERHGVSATFFLSTGFVDERRSPWFDRLANVMQAWDREPRARRALRSTMTARLAATFESHLPQTQRLRHAAAYLDALPVSERRALLKRWTPHAGDAERADARPLAWQEVEEMARRGMDFGALGVTHTTFTRMRGSEARAEIHRSIRRVAQRVGHPVSAFAYPNGIADDDVVRWAEEAGVRLAFALGERENLPDADPLRLARRTVHQATSTDAFGRFSLAHFWCSLSGVFEALSHGRAAGAGTDKAPTALVWTGPLDHVQRVQPSTPSAQPLGSRGPRPGRVPAQSARAQAPAVETSLPA